MKATLNFLGVTLMLVLATSMAKADFVNPLNSQGDYNVIVLGSFYSSGWADIEGNTAVRKDVTVESGFSFGNNRSNSDPNTPTLVVGGTMHTGTANYTNVQGGSVYYNDASSNKFNGLPFYHNDGIGKKEILKDNPIDFARLESDLRSFSDGLGFLGDTGTVSMSNGSNMDFRLSGTNNVLNISLADLYNQYGSTDFNNVRIFGDSDATLLINIYGDSIYDSLVFGGGFDLYGIDADNVLFNLIDVATMEVEDKGHIYGSVLGVDTDLDLAGFIDGTAVFKDVHMTGSAEFHNGNNGGGFDPGVPEGPAATPEPGTALMFLLGLIGFPVYRRFARGRA